MSDTSNNSDQPYDTRHRPPNLLINEKSPYLLQHAYDPVQWYPWGEAAFERSKAENKPIFLSIGYSTCHWCHVMEKESFEDPEVAELMNTTCVCIKVDREERPDIDSIYMDVCQAITGRGGWPLTILMTPDKEPFFAATYIPKRSRFGNPGMLELIPHIAKVWMQQQEDILQTARELKATLSSAMVQISAKSTCTELDEKTLHNGYSQLLSAFDEQAGGFGRAPKFPSPHNLTFLLRYWHRTGNPKALQMVTKTLDAMRRGGIYDHIGFGFHRYSTDGGWLVPHFEKMLYDQAMLIMAYTESFQVTGIEDHRQVAEEIIKYVLRDMRSAEGTFYCAEDADSEGVEGKFYLWKKEEIYDILPVETADLVCKVYEVSSEGNYKEEISGITTRQNILHLTRPMYEIARELGLSLDELLSKLESSKKILFAARERRIHPSKDDKVLTDWNGLMIAALGKASRAFERSEYAQAASEAANFILEHMSSRDGRLLHRYRDGEASINGFLEDYAFFVWGLIELYQATLEKRYLEHALRLNSLQMHDFMDDEGGFFHTSKDSETLLFRKKDVYDGAIPSGNSVSMLNLIRLSRMTGTTYLEEKAYASMKVFSSQIDTMPMAYPQFLQALDFIVGQAYEVVIAGNKKDEDTKEMLSILNRPFLPNMVLLLKEDDSMEELAPYTKNMIMGDGRPRAYVCQDYSCNMPIMSVFLFKGLISSISDKWNATN
ncbi:MAG: thioredoxin domain-containing protein [Methanomethylovorans sp.]|uniref:thioredoxin domain-containing protein n=1 Tax=Methanomethylovorans sp. TaxID=2758717 RepID=UPI000ADCEB6F|nr:thioredoxin domain-containing protein [Methanomethylovorans sp.]